MVFYVLGMVLYFLGMLTAKVRLYLSGTTNEHKCALTEGSASKHPSGLKFLHDININWENIGVTCVTVGCPQRLVCFI